jgi:antitoxin YefM
MKAITVSEFRNNMKKHLDNVIKSMEILIVPRTKDDDAVVIMPLKQYNALVETDYLLSSDSNRSRLLESIDQIQDDKNVPFDPSAED